MMRLFLYTEANVIIVILVYIWLGINPPVLVYHVVTVGALLSSL